MIEQKDILSKKSNRILNRDSNIELLRIIAMLAIIAHHLVGHGGILAAGPVDDVSLIWGTVLVPGGKIGFDCFIAISAWYCANIKFSGNRFLKIWFQVLFYNFLGFSLAWFFNSNTVYHIDKKQFWGNLFPIFGDSHGFAVMFMIFMLILPLLQLIADKMTKYNFKAIMCLTFCMQILQPLISSVTKNPCYAGLGHCMMVFIFIYFLAVYIKKFTLMDWKKLSY